MITKIINVSGKRKKAIARAVARPGTGVVRVNSRLIDDLQPKEIAGILGISQNNASVRIAHGLAAIRKHIQI